MGDRPKQCGTSDGVRHWVNIEPCGLICGLFTYVFLAYGMYSTTTCVIKPWLGYSVLGSCNIFLFNGISLVAMYSHFAAMTTDPGSVPRSALPLADDDQEFDQEANEKIVGTKFRKYCKRCKSFKPIRAHHCSICSRCIVKMDHHCPWVNNCIGVGNHKLFLLFIFWVCVVCFYALVLIVAKYIACYFDLNACGSANDNIFIIVLLVESVLFGLFTLCMMGDQSAVVSTNQTQIDRLKNTHHVTKVRFNEVFGCPDDVKFRFDWLVPTPVHFPDVSTREQILGFRQLRESADEDGEKLLSGVGNPLVEEGVGSIPMVEIKEEILDPSRPGAGGTDGNFSIEGDKGKGNSHHGNSNGGNGIIRRKGGPP